MTDILNAFVLLANFVLIPGLAYGSQLALGALGVTMVYSVLRFSNFAHGELMSFGAMFCVLITWGLQSAGISITPLPTALLALPAAILLTIALALMTDKLVFSYYRRQRSETVTYLIVSVGVMFFIGGLIRFIIGPDDRVFADGQRFLLKARTFKDATGLSEGLAIKTSQGVTIILAFVVVAALFWFLNRTKTGKSMRAYSDNEDLALLSGINPERVVMITWIITGALAALAGTLYGLDKSYKPFTYLSLLLPIFASAIVGGVGSPIGAIAGGYVIAFSELLVTFAYKKVISYLTFEQVVPEGLVQLLSTDYKIAVSFVILLIVLLIRPTGLFSGKTI
ncbi:MAG: High-affinity branched-chain amino acid transport system permease protein LivH [Rhodospirillaceae bacterium]|jgi:branched-chain amino acid transport system permease protein|nr:branched-chain amino acid ABC transporter permease [Alphaproteobacteria bacterium]CAI8388953.1 MAG: High-affinity branched-chain amino acid transport system permease protein LivH [Rhodospirillaceae bacterium]